MTHNIPISSDLDVFFTDQELAQSVTVAGQVITAIVTDFYNPIDLGEAGIEGADIQLIVQTVDVPGLKHNDPVLAGDKNFLVVDIKPSNSGISRIRLSEL